MTTRVHVFVDGVVQGVGFRWSMRDAAQRAGAVGWVRNLADGRVEAEVEGSDAQVDTVLDWARTGPRGAHVTGVETAAAAPRGGTDFEVRRDG